MVSDEQWDEICRRAEVGYVYAVNTTGIYCRPPCPSRRPLRDNVAVFESTGGAEEAGYRPCKRCLPGGGSTAERHARLVAESCRLIESDTDEAPNLLALASAAGMSPSHYHRVFKAVTGVTPKAYSEAARDRRTREALAGAANVTDVIYESGFGSSGHFYATSSRRLGMVPTRFRDGGNDETIRFAVAECSLGPVLVAATERGICSIAFDDDPNQLVHDLEDRFARAELVGGDEQFEGLVADVIGLIEGSDRSDDLPLDIRGTAFQQRVWGALQDVPIGTTVSYGELARRLGAPGSARAVASACAKNTIGVAIPCHRVVRGDGSLAGYRWGVERKRELLRREGAV